MALIAQEIPKVGLVMDEVKVIRWLKSVGDVVVAGEPLLEVETEKSVVEIEAAATGRLAQILVEVDGQAAVGDQVAWIESEEAQSSMSVTSAPRTVDHGVPASPAVASATQVSAAATTSAAETSASAVSVAMPRDSERIRSTPVARKLAGEHGVDLGSISGTGPGGRIQLADVQRAVDTPRPLEPGAQLLSSMRRAVARSMSLSNATIPQFTVSRSVEWTVLQALRGEYSARLPSDWPKLSMNDFLLQAVAWSLIEFPALNAIFSGDPESPDARVVSANGAHIGLVVAVDNGLLVPVFHHVEGLGLREIARRRQDSVERGLKGRLRREEADGATFSISNLGAEGPDRFTAIINPPQSAILAVGRRRECVVVREGAIVARPISDLTLTVDHRVADGRLASQFLARLIEILESRHWRLD